MRCCWDLTGREERREQPSNLLLVVELLLLLLLPLSAAVKRDVKRDFVVVVVVVVIIRELTLPNDVTLDLKDLRFRCAVVAIVIVTQLVSLSLSLFFTFSLFRKVDFSSYFFLLPLSMR